MRNRYCYNSRCSVPLKAPHRSKEHVLHNAIGGNIVSTALLCAKCNSELISDLEVEFCRQLNHFAFRLDVKRDRGEAPPVPAIDEKSGRKLFLKKNGGVVLAEPVIQTTTHEKTVTIKIEAGDRQSARKVLQDLKQKYPSLDVDKAMASFEERVVEFSDGILVNAALGGRDFFRVAIKCALNVFIHRQGDSKHIAASSEFVFYDEGALQAQFFTGDSPVKKRSLEVFHAVGVFGFSEEKILCAYVEFFNVVKIIAILAKNYEGPNLNHTLVFDLMARKEKKVLFDFPLEPLSLNDFIQNQEVDLRRMQSDLNTLNFPINVTQAINRSIEKAQLDPENFMSIVAHAIGEEMMSYIQAAHEKRRREQDELLVQTKKK